MNKVFLIGNISTDIESSTTQSGVTVARFSLAVSRRFAKEGQDSTDFFNIVCWRQLADICAKNLAKGRKVAVSGSIQIRKYQAQDGSNRQAVDIIADDVEFLSPRGDSQATENTGKTQSAPASQGLVEDASADSDLPF